MASPKYSVDSLHTCVVMFVLRMTGLTLTIDTKQQGVSFDKTTTIPPWKYLYLVFGALAILCGIAVTIWMPDSPLHARFLTQEEKIATVERIRESQTGTENKVLKREQVYEAFTDIRSWLIVLTTMLSERSRSLMVPGF